MESKNSNSESVVTPELFFLISKFLSAGPLENTAKVLIKELEQKKVLPKRLDWLGGEHDQTFAELERKYAHIGPNHLLEICSRIGPILDREVAPSVSGIISLLGSGRQSLLRTKESLCRPRSQLDYCTRIHGVSLPDSSITKPLHNLQKVLIGREYGGPVRRKMLVPTSLYNKTKLLRRTVGHLSSVYCVLFDRTGRYIITGADDLLIKIWSSIDGRLLATLRGASAEITDIAINLDNTMLAAGSIDRILRVWDMQTTSPIAVLSAHTGMITSVNFCPSPRSDLKYLVTTSTDGSIAFWQYSTPRGQKITFAPKPTQYHEKLRPGQAQMMCTTFSPGGMFLAAGSADHHVRVYLMSDEGPKRILETEAYTDAVDSVQWSHRGLRFISGSKDGTAHIWTFESQQWRSLKLCMTERLPTCPELEEGKKLKVTMVAWDCSDKYVITAVNDFTIKIWNSKTAKLHCVLRGHKDELYVLESNPKDEHVLLSAGHDGQVFLWDIEQGISVAHFINDIDGQGHGGVFDAKWSPDGTMIAATDSHGHILIFGLGIGPDKYKLLPTELFFHTDYRPLLRDVSHHVVDEQTQVMPHLMPPPFLVDSDGNPHPAKYQRYVPGRESCSSDQLIPNITVGADGVVVDDNPSVQNAGGNYHHIDRLIAALANRQGNASAALGNNQGANHSQLDRLIEALANRQGQEQAPDSNNRASNSRSRENLAANGLEVSAQNENPSVNRNPARGSWYQLEEQQGEQQQPVKPLKYIRRIYVRPMKYQQLQSLKQTVYAAGQFEMLEYKREMRRRPIMINTSNTVVLSQTSSGRQKNTRSSGGTSGRAGRRRQGQVQGQGQGQVNQQRPAYRTRAVRDQEVIDAVPEPQPEEEEDEESSASSGDTSYSNVEENLDSSDDSDTESSDYSDWVADTPGPNLEPPKRAKRKPLSRRRTVSEDSSVESEQATTSAGVKPNRRNKRVIPKTAPNGEIPELYKPAEWLSEVIPRKAPYYPQMGDEIVYFRQGHHRYLEAVRQKNVFKLSHSSEPWNFHTLRDHELVRVIGIKYEIRPPRLCCLKLAIIDEDGNMTGTTFKIKYHDMPDVLDFLVLRQTFDLAVQRNWCIGDRFRCMIGDGWWMGQIESRHPLSSDFPDSFFMCFRVRWDNGEYEYMSPWDMEPIDENRLPDEIGGAVSVLPEEIRATLYQPKSEEWHRGDRDGSCRRIINGLEQVMRLSIAEHFLAPVDLNIYPDYAYMIEYPIDLTTVKSRFENHFYRRITSAQFDVRYLATNAEKYNRSHTNIVKHARIITDLCLRVIREPSDIDVAAVYHQLVDVYHSSETENDNDSDVVPSTSTGPSTSAAAKQKMSASTARRSNRIRSDGDWRSDCRQLLDMMMQRPDSAPFREPVDTIEFPDYLEIISTPMDLRTVKEDLLGGNYEDPLDFAKDVRLIFQNSRNYNTNKRSRIYSMTLRLSALFESHIKMVITNWKAARRRANKQAGTRSSSSPAKKPTGERNRGGPLTRRNQKAVTRRQNSSDDDDDDDEDDDEQPRTSQRRGGVRNGKARTNASQVGQVASASGSNRVTSSSSSHRLNRPEEPMQPPIRSSRRKVNSHELNGDADEDHDNREDEENAAHSSNENTNSSNSSDSDDGDSSPDSTDVNVSSDGNKRRGVRARKLIQSDDDSEESYKPINVRQRGRGGRKRGRKSNKRNKIIKRKRKEKENVTRRGDIRRRGARYSKRVEQQLSADDTNMISVSQEDESTQDLVNTTPKKKGRPPRSSQQNNHPQSNDGPSTSAGISQASPSRTARRNLVNGGRRHVAQNDHSYHLPVRNGRLAESDTDSRDLNVRPTRASVKRAILDWAHGSDIEDNEDDSEEEAEEILPTPTPTKTNVVKNTNNNSNGPSTSRVALATAAASRGVVRQLRTNRNTVVEAIDEDSEDDDDDNKPLANSRGTQSRFHNNKTSNASPVLLSRRAPTTSLHAVAISTSMTNASGSTHMTRSHATSTTSNVATSSSSIPFGAHEQNYVVDSGPSTSSAALRNTRRVLSRHQRNADELDISTDPLENTRLLAVTSRLRRGGIPSSTSTTTVSVATSAAPNVTVRRGRSRFSQEISQPEEEENEDDDEEVENGEDVGGSDEGTDGGSSSSTESSEVSDSEDNQPLTSYVTPEKKTSRNHTSSRRLRRRISDDSYVCDDDDEDYENGLRRRVGRNERVENKSKNHQKYRKTAALRNQRGSRNQKRPRPRYNEQSDEDCSQECGSVRKRRRFKRGDASDNTVIDEEDPNTSMDSDTDEDDANRVSVSSRGRVRKITAKARGIFKD